MQLRFGNKARITLACMLIPFGCAIPALADTISPTSNASCACQEQPVYQQPDGVTISTSSVPTLTLSPSSDTITLNATSGTYDPSAGSFTFQTGDFYVGVSDIPDQVILFVFQDTITLNDITQVINIFGQDNITAASDELTIFAGTPIVFGDQIFTLQAADINGVNSYADMPLDLEATVIPTPEPGSIFLIGTGVLALAFLLQLKNREGGDGECIAA